MTNIRWKPAMYAAAAPMNVLPVPISPTTVVPRWAFEGEGRAANGVGLRPQGLSEKPGKASAALRGPIEGRVGLDHPLRYRIFELVDKVS